MQKLTPFKSGLSGGARPAKRVYDSPSKGILWGWEVAGYIITKALSAGIIGLLSAQQVVNFLTSKNKKSIKSTMTYFEGQKISINDIKIYCNKKCKLI